MTMGPIEIIIVGIIGLMGGILGSYFSIKRAIDSKEKAFIIKIVIAGWIGTTIFLALLFLTPTPYRIFIFVPYSIIMTITIIKGNKILAKIRKEESNKK